MLKMNLKKALALLASVLILCTLIPVGALLMANAEDNNLLANGGFEDGESGWSFNSGSHAIVNDAHDGSNALSLTNLGSWAEGAVTTISVSPDTDYTITWWCKATAGTGTFNLSVMDGVTFTNMTTKGGQNWMNGFTGSWQQKTYTVNTGSSTSMMLKFTTEAANPGTVLLDSISVTKVGGGDTPDVPAYVLDMDFEDGQAGFEGASVVTDGSNCLKWTANGGWSSTQIVVSNVKRDTDYVVTFKAKGSVAGDMGTTLQDANWGPWWNGPSFNVTTVWHDFRIEFNTANYATAEGKMFFKFQDVGVAMDLYIDDLKMIEKSAIGDQPDQPVSNNMLINGDFEAADIAPWDNLWGGNTVTTVAGRDSAKAIQVTAGAWTHVRQLVTVEPNTDYVITVWGKNVSDTALLVKDGADTTNVAQAGLQGGSDWTQTTLEFNSGSYTSIYVSFMGNVAGAGYTVDDAVMTKKGQEPTPPPSGDDSLIVNGDFETGDIAPWDNLWGGNQTEFVTGRNGEHALKVVSSEWGHVRQKVDVEPNTNYIITVWHKNTNNVTLLVKDAGDTANVAQSAMSSGDEWTKTTVEFNSGSYNSIFVSLMGGQGGGQGTFDDISMTLKGNEPDQPDVPTYPTELINGNFEDGSNGWTLGPAASIDTDAHAGSGALKLDNPAAWAEAALQAVSVQKNTNYVITWYSKRVSGIGAFNMILMKDDNSNYTSVSGQNWMNDTSGDWVKNKVVVSTGDSNVIKFKLTNENADPGVILIDDITMIVEGSEPVDPTASLILNGSFEDGKEEWTFGGDTALYSDDYYEGSKSVKLSQSKQWSEALTQEVKVEPNAKYVIKFYTKRVSGTGVWNLNLMDADTIYTAAENLEIVEGQSYFDHTEQGKWQEHRIVFQAIGTKNKEKDVTKVLVKFSPEADGAGEYLMDYIGMWTEGNEPAPDDPDNPIVPPKSPAYMTVYGVLNNRPIEQSSNLLKNPSFEKSGGQWKEGFTGETISVVKDKTTLFGDKSLFFNTAGIEEETKLVFWMDVEPETDYVFSTWLKGAFLSDDNRGNATVGVVNEEGKFLAMSSTEDKLTLFLNGARQIVPTAWDNEWHIRGIQFNSGETTKIGIALAGTNSQMWIDDMALFEVGEGTKYMSENAGGLVHLSYDIDSVTCLDKDSLIPDPNFTTKDKAGFWADSYGWRNGFLTFEENEYEYGTSLKYTESEETTALSIIKTIKVKPHTDYTFSVDLKILQDGWGKLVLIDGKKREPINFLEIAFDSYDYDEKQSYYGWYTTASKFNTDVYDEIAIAVVNEGGVALMDNMRLYESDKGAKVTDKFIPPPEDPEEDYTDDWYDDWYGDEIIEDEIIEEIIEDEIIDEPETPTDPIVEPKPVDNGFKYLWVIIGGSALALAGGAVLVILLIAKKKKKAAAEAATEATPEENA